VKRKILAIAASATFAFSCICVFAETVAPAKDEASKKWKSSIIDTIHEKVREIDFRESKSGFSICRVSLKIKRDGSIIDLHTDDRSDGYFASQVKAQVESMAGSNLLQFPQHLQGDAVKIEFALTSDDKLPISADTKIPNSSASTSPVAATWDEWHKKIVETLYMRIYRQMEPLMRDDSRLHCVITYRIRRLGEIELLKIEGSENMVFRGIVAKEVQSLQNNPIIIFPECAGNSTSITKKSEFEFGLNLRR
jgi:hypothetical protein